MKKSLISAVCSAVLLVMFSVNAFAAVPHHPLPDYPLINVEDGDTVIGTLKTSELGDSVKSYLREWVTSPNSICTYSTQVVGFLMVANDFSGGFAVQADKSLTITGSGHYSWIYCDLITGKFMRDDIAVSNGMGTNIVSGASLGYVFSGNYFKSHPPTFSNESIIGFDGRLILRDDGGIFGGEEPPASSSDPDKPPDFKPEPPTDPFVPPAPPSFDFGGSAGDLPYDSSIWEALMWYLRDTIGSVGTVLLWVMVIIIAIPTVTSAIRHFMNQAGGDGNNTSGLI